jgi:hypothetical protein
LKGLDESAQIAGNDGLEVEIDVDAMVGATVLGKVVSADTFGSIAGSDECPPEGGAFLLSGPNLHVVEPSLEEPHGFGAVLVLAAFVLTEDDES